MVHVADYRGARGSNAGDEFHELWALEQVLGLLVPGTALRAVKIEGVETDRSGTGLDGPSWDSVDCSLYFGGDTLETADTVEFVQLKYSGDPSRAWSVARLTASSAKVRNNSVLRKLADDYRSARQRMKPEAALRLRFVSNQGVAQAAIEAVKAGAKGNPYPAVVAEDLARIHEATGLQGKDSSDFLASFDLSGCAAGSRFRRRERLILRVAKLIEDNATHFAVELRQRVRELMLPEREDDVVDRDTVLSWFGVSLPDGLFPCPAEINPAENPVVRQTTMKLAATVLEGMKLVCLHGPAGCGKSTMLTQLQDVLPEGSCVVLFDCYGGGRYRFSDDKRHLPEHAFLQIGNDVAVALATPFLIAWSGSQPTEIRQFLARLRDAANVLEAAYPEALLIIAIDAADNAVTAASLVSASERCFVPELVRADLNGLPKNLRFVVSSRTARVSSLGLPKQTATIECPAFSIDETSLYARSRWPNVSTDWIKQFHHLSNGIPRVQAYAMAAALGDPAKVLDSLRPHGKKLQEVFQFQFKQACDKIGQDALFERFISCLAVLPPPIPIDVIGAITGTSGTFVIDVAYDLSPGLRIEENGIFIADEDIDDFIKGEAQPYLTGTRSIVADYFMQHHLGDTYAAIHIADALLAAGRGAELLPLIQRDPQMEVVADPVVRREAYLRRLRLALSVCRSAGSSVDIAKVVLISAEADKDETALRQVLENHIALAVEFARSSLSRLVLANRDSAGKQGSVLAQDAARAARANDLITARERLTMHDAWLKRRRDLPDDQIDRWVVSDDDIAARAEAILEMQGTEALIRELSRWRPRSTPIAVALKLVPALIQNGKAKRLLEILHEQSISPPWDLLVMIPLALAGEAIETSHLKRALGRLRRAFVPQLRGWHHPGSDSHWSMQWHELLLSACELAVNLGVSRTVIDRGLRLLDGPVPTSATQAFEMDAKIRIWLLRTHLRKRPLTVERLLLLLDPSSKKTKKKTPRQSNSSSRDRRVDELRAATRVLFPIYVCRLDYIRGSTSIELDASKPAMEAEINDYHFDSEYWSKFLRAQLSRSIMQLMILPRSVPSVLFERAKRMLHGRFKDSFKTDVIPLLNQLALRQSEQEHVQEIATLSADDIKKIPSAASEKVDSCLRFSRVLLRVSPDDAERLFASAIDLAKEIDWEAAYQIEVLAALAIVGADNTPDRKRTAIDVFQFASVAATCLAAQDHFPWADVARTLARLSVSIAFAGLATWADKGTVTLQTTLAPFLEQVAKDQSLAPETLTALAILLERPDSAVYEAILRGAQKRGGTTLVQEELARDCLLHSRPGDRLKLARLILSFARDSDELRGANLSLLKRTVAFLEEQDRKDDKGSVPSRVQRDTGSPDIDMSGRRFVTSAEIRAALDLAAQTKPYRTREVLIAMRKVTRLADRILFLDALTDVELSLEFEADRVDAIADALATWAKSPSVDGVAQ